MPLSSFLLGKHMKIKILGVGYAGFTGLFGQVEFKDAISVDHVSKMEANRLGSILQIVEVDEEGNEVKPVGIGQHDIDCRKQRAEIAQPLEIAKVEPVNDEKIKAKVEEQSIEEPNQNVAKIEVKKYTEAELEVIADEKGIVALREIGDPLNAKSNSISGLIPKILAAQKG